MQDPRTARSRASRGPLWLGLWLGFAVALVLIFLASRLPTNQVIAFTMFGASIVGLIAFTLKISNEDRKRGHDD
jgi:hypothetical protein